MANLLLTSYCNRTCPYCFAQETMAQSGAQRMSLGEIVDIADQILGSGGDSLGLLGGEPTLHPEFVEIVGYLLRRGLKVRVFTNALVRPGLLERIEALPRERLRFIVNVNSPEIETPEHHRRQIDFIRRLPSSCDLGVNVYRPDLDLSFLVDVASRAGLTGAWIRIGLAQPIVGEANDFLRLEDYRRVTASIVRLAVPAFERKLRLGFDCGFPLCAFSDEQLGCLYRCGANLRFACKAAVDIAPGHEAWSCFPLAQHTRIRYDGHGSIKQLTEVFYEGTRKTRERLGRGVFAECATCVHAELGQCDGGCIAHLVGKEATVEAPAAS